MIERINGYKLCTWMEGTMCHVGWCGIYHFSSSVDLLEQTQPTDFGRMENSLKLSQLHLKVERTQTLLQAKKGRVHELNNFSNLLMDTK